MVKIIVADDEELIRKGLVKVISKYEAEFQVIGEASNGREVLELMENHLPEVIITDVKMPKMDGVELVKELECRYPEVKKIVISGFSDFNYVRETMRNGALDYLLKPIDDEQLIAMLIKITESIKNDKEQKLVELNLKEKISESLPLLKEQFLRELISENKYADDEIIKKCGDYHILLNPGYYSVVILSVDNYKWICKEFGIEAAKSDAFIVKDIAEEIISRFETNVSFSDLVGQIFIISTSQNNKDLIQYTLHDIINNLKHKAPEIRVTLSLGKPVGKVSKLADSYRDAVELLKHRFYNEESGIVSGLIQETTVNNGAKTNLVYSLVENLTTQLNNCIEIEDCIQVQNILKDFHIAMKKYKLAPLDVVKIFIDVYVKLQSNYPEFGKSVTELYGYDFYYIKTIESFDTLDILIRYNSKLYYEVIKKITEIRNRKDKKLVKVIKDYILEHYQEPLSLNTIAEITYLSPSYISDLFKNQTGANITDYLTTVRIEKAKILLKDIKIKSYEIGEMVGYSDPAYFTKVFKKVVGVSPNEYRNIVI